MSCGERHHARVQSLDLKYAARDSDSLRLNPPGSRNGAAGSADLARSLLGRSRPAEPGANRERRTLCSLVPELDYASRVSAACRISCSSHPFVLRTTLPSAPSTTLPSSPERM